MTPEKYLALAIKRQGIELFVKPLRNATATEGAGKSPLLYDIPLLTVLRQGSRSEVEAAISSKEIANSQNRNGETLLMKAMRNIINEAGVSRTWLVHVLLERGADCMVCCDSKKNILHDVLWASKPPPNQVLQALEVIIGLLCKHLGRDRMLTLLASPDRLGQTPVQYILPEYQTNFQELIDTIVGYEQGLEASESAASPSTQETNRLKRNREGVEDEDYEDYSIVANVCQLLDQKDAKLMQHLQDTKASFLLSELSDPDAHIIAASPAFCKVTLYSCEEVLGQNCRFLQGPKTDYRDIQQIRAAIKNRKGTNVSVLNYRKDGSEFDNNFALLPLHCNQVPRYFLGIQDCKPSTLVDYASHMEFMSPPPVPEAKPEAPALLAGFEW